MTINEARERAQAYRRMAKSGLNPRFNANREVPTFEELSRQVHIDRLPTWKNAKHGRQWVNTLRDYAFPKIGRMPVDSIDQPEGQYLPLSYAQLKSPAWRSLSGTAIKLWLELHTRYNGGNNGALTLSFAEAAEILGMSKGTVQRAYDELVDRGFLVRVREGNWYHRRAHEWRLTTKSMQTPQGRVTATQDWRTWCPQKTKRGTETDPSAPFLGPPEYPRRRYGSV